MDRHSVEMFHADDHLFNDSFSVNKTFLRACVKVTDLPQVLPHTMRNITSNTPPAVLPLLWGHDLERFSSQWELVLGSDIVYIPEMFPLLLHTLLHLHRERGTHDFYHTLLTQRFHVKLVHRDDNKNINIC
ncbi:EEF1A lysine methyltransferase 3-like, partial [Tachysurus fulvidraco]|uniref:EEF1A lysine methyltransferase 3-like n=1 Tax=Tachysurus fulvidraco TaxID=1234273 RepID=UPI001FEF191D